MKRNKGKDPSKGRVRKHGRSTPQLAQNEGSPKVTEIFAKQVLRESSLIHVTIILAVAVTSLAIAPSCFIGCEAAEASSDGCYPTYDKGRAYRSGDMVSATTIVTVMTPCRAGNTRCPFSGFKDTQVVETYNYECVEDGNSVYCGREGYEPDGVHGSLAWTKMAACKVRLFEWRILPLFIALQNNNNTDAYLFPIFHPKYPKENLVFNTPSTPAAWQREGCPKKHSYDVPYSAGDVVSVPMSYYTMVYQCAEEPLNLVCGMVGYAPGKDRHWKEAWTELGSCEATMTPTSSPVYNFLPDTGGCPLAYDNESAYDVGDRVSRDGLVYQCKAWPRSSHCSSSGYEPVSNPNTRGAWEFAWAVVGYCEGTAAPTSSPNFVALPDMGGCPAVWERTIDMADDYNEGDHVSASGLVFQCKPWPYSSHCGQDGYAPGTNPATPGAWRLAWIAVGHCSGSIAPTNSPIIDNSIGNCPDEWTRQPNDAYEAGDMVSVVVSASPLRKVAYACKQWPYSVSMLYVSILLLL